MRKILIFAIITCFFTLSCKKKTVTTTTAATTFLNSTAGSVWNYKTYDSTTSQETTYSLTSTNMDSMVNGRIYHVFSNTSQSGTTSEYYNITGNEYYQYAEVIPQQSAIEQKYLIDNVNTGTSWTTPFFTQIDVQGNAVTITGTIKNTIEEKGGSLSLNGTNYNNIIKVKTELLNVSISVPIIGNLTPTIVQNSHSYYAPKYGMVKKDLQLQVSVDVPTMGTQEVINTNTSTILMYSTIL